LQESYEKTKKLLLNKYKWKLYPSAETELTKLVKYNLNTEQWNMFQILYQWRDYHAKSIDEAPDDIFNTTIMMNIIKQHPTSKSELMKITGYHSESLITWQETVLRFNIEQTNFMATVECHICGGKGHCAWSCVEEKSKNLHKEYYRSNPDKKTAQNKRRNANKKRNKQLF